MKLLHNMWTVKATDNADGITMLTGNDGFTFAGTSILSNNSIIQGHGNVYAVRIDVDVWVTPTMYNYAIIELDTSFADKLRNAVTTVASLTAFYKELQVLFKTMQVADSSVPAGPDSTKFVASVSGVINVFNNFEHRGGNYGNSGYLAATIQVGSGIQKQHSVLIKAVAQFATLHAVLHLNKHTHNKYSSFKSSGTNYSTVALKQNYK